MSRLSSRSAPFRSEPSPLGQPLSRSSRGRSTQRPTLRHRSTPRFLCVVIPDFPTWAALGSDASLAATCAGAAAVAGRDLLIYSSGRIISASAGARRAGVGNGWSLQRAQSLLPEAICLARSASTEAAAWQGVLRSLNEVTPLLESVRPGLALLHVEPPSAIFAFLRQTCLYGSAHDGAHGGMADDRTTAELTAYSAKAGTLRVLKPVRGHSFLHTVPVDTLAYVGVGSETIQRLHWFGWHHVGDLRAATRKQLVQQFLEGELLYCYAQAKDVRPIGWYAPPPTVQAHFVWDEAVREPAEVEPVLELLLQQAVAQLQGRSTQEITVKAETINAEGAEGFCADHRLLREPLMGEPLTDFKLLHLTAQQVLQSALCNRAGVPIQRLEVELGGLAQPRPLQGRLFGVERPGVQAALRAVERRFPGAVRRLIVQDAHAYVPERFARLEPLDAKQVAAISTSTPYSAKRSTRSRKPAASHRWSEY